MANNLFSKAEILALKKSGMFTDTPFELVGDVTTEEAVNSIIVTLQKPCRYVSITFIIPPESAGKSRNVYFSSESTHPTSAFHRSSPAATSESNFAIYKTTAEIIGGEVISYGGISGSTSQSIDYQVRKVDAIFTGYGGIKADNFTTIYVFSFSDSFPIGSSVKIYGC